MIHRNSGFTLIEMLVAITIFVGVITLSLAIFSQTINAGNRGIATEKKTEAVRSIVDQISNDFNYLAIGQLPPECTGLYAGAPQQGFCISYDKQSLYLLLAYPNDTSNYYEKIYHLNLGGLTVSEIKCATNSLANCQIPTDNHFANLVDTNLYSVTSNNTCSLTGAADTFCSTAQNLITTDPVSLTGDNNVTFHPSGYLTLDIGLTSKDNSSGVYEISTTLVPGGLQ